MEHRGDGAAGLAGWRVGRGGSCHHRRRHCCWWSRGWSRGGDREAVREVGALPKHMMEAELLTTFQKVAIVDEVTIIKDKRPLVVWIRTPRSRISTSKLPCCLVLCFDFGFYLQAPVLSCSAFDFGFYLQAPVLSCSVFDFGFYLQASVLSCSAFDFGFYMFYG
uniref:Uncharacterized protein n=1 Tax=Oryza nivara TaxID=4536 RepID=A0A0E0J7T3_ORYNI